MKSNEGFKQLIAPV